MDWNISRQQLQHIIKSHPTWVCGLKLWKRWDIWWRWSHTLRGCVDWNHFTITSALRTKSHTLRGCVDWNIHIFIQYLLSFSHTLRGCVDWNNVYRREGEKLRGSHPTWVCGLKPCYWQIAIPGNKSHPTWVCGLKQIRYANYPKDYFVTPYVGVWIETINNRIDFLLNLSHPTWVCGLKRAYYQYITLNHSHTLRGCVDWNNDEVNTCIDNQSHPTWVCGLKQRDWQEKMWGMVTPYVGVWIETLELAFNADGFQGHTLRGCVDWNAMIFTIFVSSWQSHPTWVCGLKPPVPCYVPKV